MLFFKRTCSAVSRRSGFTLIEIMVVIVIMGLLAGIAVPKLMGLIEKSREKTDLAWVYYIKNAIEHQIAAHGGDISSVTTAEAHGGSDYYGWTSVAGWLKDKSGLQIFRIEPRNAKSTPKGETSFKLFNGRMPGGADGYSGGILYDAMNELGWGDIFKNVASGNAYNSFKGPFFTSRALTHPKSEGGVSDRYWVKARWESSNPNKNPAEEGTSVIVWLGQGDWNDPLIGNYGTCFSTEPKACK